MVIRNEYVICFIEIYIYILRYQISDLVLLKINYFELVDNWYFKEKKNHVKIVTDMMIVLK